MEDKLITFETAKLANEKGFNVLEGGYSWYKENGEIEYSYQAYWEPFPRYAIAKPTQSLLQKWLRDVHNKHLIIAYGKTRSKYDILHSSDGGEFDSSHDTYEEALEIGLFEVLKLIK